jgi:Asp-tRNA(Asn)/Glu-tRNA(Gln) amidotransferase A subunit family amidase
LNVSCGWRLTHVARRRVDGVERGTPPTTQRRRDYANDFLTAFASLAGLPAVSVPFGRTSGGLPVGVQVVGKAFDEACVLRTARRLELIRDDALSSPARRVLLSDD